MRNFYLSLLLLCLTAASHAGVIIGGTRFIYHEGQKSLGVTLRNTSNRTWLVNTTLYSNGKWAGTLAPMAKQNPARLSAVPPLFSLKPGRENSLRIIQTSADLPKDRETLFTLSVAAIPSGHANGNAVQMAVRTNLKLIYRPSGLKGESREAWRQLKWIRQAHGLQVSNPTPYYVTLFNLSFNGHPHPDAGVVAPYSQRTFTDCQATAGCLVKWQTLNDFGKIMPVATAAPSAFANPRSDD